ncbi:MAG: zinc metallopeptidase [Lentisphaeria bacterium]|nr:zinc metallopeptidase [Lentisphaeria bacterium]
MWWYDPLYLLFALPGLVLAMLASFYVKSTFATYSRVPSDHGYTGAEAARRMLAAEGVSEVRIEATRGMLSDHYDPLSRTLRLSPEVYGQTSLAAIGVACHEAGHALQHARGYALLGLRTAMVPVTSFGSNLSYILIIVGFIFHSKSLILAGALLFSLAVLFALVTLPVEWDASARARRGMVQAGIVSTREGMAAAKVLQAAFLTYVAAAVNALLILAYYLLRAGVFRRDD